MALNENQILNMLNDGYDSDCDIPENDVSVLLRNFENDDFRVFLETLHEEEQSQVKVDVNEAFGVTTAHLTGAFNFSTKKKNIEWINKPYQAP